MSDRAVADRGRRDRRRAVVGRRRPRVAVARRHPGRRLLAGSARSRSSCPTRPALARSHLRAGRDTSPRRHAAPIAPTTDRATRVRTRRTAWLAIAPVEDCVPCTRIRHRSPPDGTGRAGDRRRRDGRAAGRPTSVAASEAGEARRPAGRVLQVGGRQEVGHGPHRHHADGLRVRPHGRQPEDVPGRRATSTTTASSCASSSCRSCPAPSFLWLLRIGLIVAFVAPHPLRLRRSRG